MTTYDIKFFFPYDKIILENVPSNALEWYKEQIRFGRTFDVSFGTAMLYVINPALLTYVEINKHKPF